MNVSRRTVLGEVNLNEPNQQQLYMTSAGVKSSYAYMKLIDLLEMQIINPKEAFVWGCDYRVPVMHGLLDRSYIKELQMSPSYNEETFAREYKDRYVLIKLLRIAGSSLSIYYYNIVLK